MSLTTIARALARDVDRLHFAPPVELVLNPLVYAWAPHALYLERYGRLGAGTLLVGMNPGPFGMTQTGVPFGEVAAVRDWLGIEAAVGRPPREHPKRPIEGFLCPRSEVSGRRLWGWARARFRTAAAFHARFFVWNYCPLVFLEASGRNRTPDKLTAGEREALYAICDRALARVVAHLEVARVIGIGAFAMSRARVALAPCPAIAIGTILHPSPASPAANRGWEQQIEIQLRAQGVAVPE